MPASNQPTSSQPASNQPTSNQPATSQSFRRLWLAPRAIALHVVILAVIPTFAALCDWQVHRALAGNDLSWAYVFEWPFFAGYAVYMWWRFLHDAPPEPARPAASQVGVPAGEATTPAATAASGPPVSPEAAAGRTSGAGADIDEDADADERAAYNRYLAQLATRGKRKQWR